MTARQDITPPEVRSLLEAIRDAYGYDLTGYAPASIGRRVRAMLAKSELGDIGELQRRIVGDPTFFGVALEALTIQVSEMFRDPDFYLAFRANVVPILRTYPLLKIWLGGCATGEEAYSTAIILHEEGLADRTQIYATDLSPQAIEHAKQGMYSAKRLDQFVANYARAGGRAELGRYYTAAYDGIAMNEIIRRNISFFQHSLVSDRTLGEMHVIFCRNVLIYFDRDLQRRVVDTLAQSLCPGGFLCLGASERLPRSETAFVELDAATRIYRHAGPR